MVEALREDIRTLQEGAAACARARRRVVRLDRDLPPARRRPPERSRRFEKGLLENDPGHRQLADVRLGLHQGGRPLRQRRAQPDRRFPGRVRARAASTRSPIAGKDFKTGQTLMKTVIAPGLKARMLGLSRLVLDQHPRQPRRRGARRSRQLQVQGGLQARRARLHPPARALPRALRQDLPQGAHRVLPAARRRQGGLGQHRYLRVARLPDADQDQLPLPRLDPRRADRARSRALHGSRAARAASAACRSG